MNRRHFLQQSTSLASLSLLTGCAHRILPKTPAPPFPSYDAVAPIPPIRADIDRLFRITVCTRPFRATGPRLDTERLNNKLILHNYGHGGSGWSLSWGSAQLIITKALQAATTSSTNSKDLAVIGCGAIGLTTALTAQRAGFRVSIYAKERFPYIRSARATGSWTPDSRIALTNAISPDFPAQWESMARTSFSMHQSFLGSPGYPVEFTDRYSLRDLTEAQLDALPDTPSQHQCVSLRSRIKDLTPGWHEIPPGSHPFSKPYVYRSTSLTFNIADYARTLLNDFLTAGGQIETREFHSPSDLTALPQPLIVNCTGYGARQLWSDESITPVRGQIAWLIPQEGVNYGVYYNDLAVLARRDGIVVQPNRLNDDTGWGDASETPDRAEAEDAVRQLQTLYKPNGIRS